MSGCRETLRDEGENAVPFIINVPSHFSDAISGATSDRCERVDVSGMSR